MDAFWLALASQIVTGRREMAIVYAERTPLEGIRASGLVAGA